MADITPALLHLIHRLADASGDVIRPLFRGLPGVDYKADESPVTVADQRAEEAIRTLLAKERPADGIWGEELGQERLDAEWVWTIDPIDGTRAFVTGKPMFATLIGLMHRGLPVLGVIDQPVTRERWVGGKGVPAQFNGKPIQTRACTELGRAYMNSTTPDMFKGQNLNIYLQLKPLVRDALYGGDAYAYGLLAMGMMDLVVEADLKLHDVVALAAVIDAAGGAVTDWHDRPMTFGCDGRMLASGDKKLHAQALAILAAVDEKAA